jgi:hypothetical protein
MALCDRGGKANMGKGSGVWLWLRRWVCDSVHLRSSILRTPFGFHHNKTAR